ncbi:MAG: hypothetical protein ACFFG0_15055 [Candidatus Thorarchaeota archaeon]
MIVGDYWLEVRAYDSFDNFCSAIIKITIIRTTSTSQHPRIFGYDSILLIGMIFVISTILIKKRSNEVKK